MRRLATWPMLLSLLAIGCLFPLISCSNFSGSVPEPEASTGKTTPVITWAQPAPITYPTPLSRAQLDASANVPGTFVYTPVAGTILPAGIQNLSAVFTPVDATKYDTATASVRITVNTGTNSGSCPPPGPQPTTGGAHLAIADTGNGRVLIFDAPFTTGECASIVLGQADFESDEMLSPESSSKIQQPVGMALDASGDLFVADYNGGRIMQFQPPFTNDMPASLELGVPDFGSPGDVNDENCYNNPPGMSLCMPSDVSVDGRGDVWVADTWEGRVVEYRPPIERAMNASLAIGQPDVDDTANCDGIYTIARDNTGAPATTTASEFCNPVAATVDGQGNLWVADAGNDRVLEFIPPFLTGMSASLELGFPPDVGMNSPTPFADGWKCAPNAYLCGPASLAFDAEGDLWVADNGNNRVLEFVPPFSNGMAASLVIGQPDFVHTAPAAVAANSLHNPHAVAFDSNGDLVVGDSSNNRVLVYSPPFSNGMSASVVLGQPDMTTNIAHGCGDWTDPPQFGEPDASTFCNAWGVLAF